MYRLRKRFCRKFGLALLVAGLFLLYSVAVSQAAAVLVTDSAEWEAMVSDIEVLTTTAENVLLADEVTIMPGPNAKLGPILTFQSSNTGLTRGFSVESLQAQGQSDPGDLLFEGGFTFNDHDGGVPITDSADALSVGDTDDFEDDDWQLNLLGGATVNAFGVEIRHSRDMIGETITLFLMSENEIVETINLALLPDAEQAGTVFLGIVSDLPFDRILFDENADTDDIAIADFRFATVLPSEIEATVNIKPDTINLKSKGRYVTAYIELPEGYSVEEIDRGSVVISEINGDVIDPALHTVGPWQIGDHDRDGIPDLMVKFDRQELIPLLKVTDKTITVSGVLADGTQFTGTDNSRIIKHKKKFCHFNKYRHLFTKWNSR